MHWIFELIYKHGDVERHPGPSAQLKKEETKREDRQREETATITGKRGEIYSEKMARKVEAHDVQAGKIHS